MPGHTSFSTGASVSQSPSSFTDTSMTTASTTNAPTTATSDFLITNNTTTDDVKATSTIEGQKDTLTGSQSTSPGLITGVAIGGALTGGLITLLATLMIAAIVCLVKKNQDKLTPLSMNQILQGINGDKDMEVKDAEEPIYMQCNTVQPCCQRPT